MFRNSRLGGDMCFLVVPWRHMSHISLPGPFTHSYRSKKWTGRRLIWTFMSRPKSSCHLFLGKRTLWDFVERAWNFSVTRGIILHFRYLNPLVLKAATSRPNPNSSLNKKAVKTSTSIGTKSQIVNSSWWLDQPIWKICSSNWIISPIFGVNIKKKIETTN